MIKLKIKESQLQKLLEKIRESLKTVEEKNANLREVMEKHRAGLTAAKEAELKKSLEEVYQRLQSVEPQAFAVVHREGLKEPETGVEIVKEPKEFTIVTLSDKGDKETLTAVVKTKLKKADRNTCEQAVEKMKGELPDGFSLDYEFDEDSGTAVFKIKTPPSEEQKAKELLEKLLKLLEE